jgi:hypothetical protein
LISDFPLAPERVTITKDDLSEHTVRMAESCGVNMDNMKLDNRLCLTLKDKKVHYRNLQFYTKHGLCVTKIHRVLTFTQVPFLQSFMLHCADKRRAAKSQFYKTLWKSIANLVSLVSFRCISHLTYRKSICGSWGTIASASSKKAITSMCN